MSIYLKKDTGLDTFVILNSDSESHGGSAYLQESIRTLHGDRNC